MRFNIFAEILLSIIIINKDINRVILGVIEIIDLERVIFTLISKEKSIDS